MLRIDVYALLFLAGIRRKWFYEGERAGSSIPGSSAYVLRNGIDFLDCSTKKHFETIFPKKKFDAGDESTYWSK